MASANRSEFLTGIQRRYGTFTLPASGRVVRFQSLSEGEHADLEISKYERDKLTEELLRDEQGRLIPKEGAIRDSRAYVIIAALVDDEGHPLLTVGDLEQIKLLDSADTMPLYAAINEHLGLTARADPSAKKNTVPNSETTAA